MAAVEPVDRGGWRAELSLSFARRNHVTVIAARRHRGPLYVQQPFYPGDGACHAYLLHPPGGIAGGDELIVDVGVGSGAGALLTTPAATKFYRSDGAAGVQRQTLRAAAGATLEWLPQESILFGGSRAVVETDVELERDARFIGWEQLSLGRPLSGDRYESGSLEQHTRICVDGEPLLVDSLRWQAGDRLLAAEWGLAGFGVCGALYAYPVGDLLLVRIRELLGAATPANELANRWSGTPLRGGATRLGELLVVRCLGAEPEAVRKLFESLWRELRPGVVRRAPSPPRVWST